MANQSKRVSHYFYNEEIENTLDYCDFDLEYDTRPKIEDLDLFRRELERANLMNSKLDEFIDNYLKFNND